MLSGIAIHVPCRSNTRLGERNVGRYPPPRRQLTRADFMKLIKKLCTKSGVNK